MEEKEKQASVPYFIHEGAMARMERIIKILTRTIVAVLLVAVILFIINNVIWMRYTDKLRQETQNIEVSDGVQQQPDGGAD